VNRRSGRILTLAGGFGRVEFAPMSDERRAIIARETEKERKAAELEEQARRDAALERRWKLERQGVVPHSVADVLARAPYGMDRADKAEERREREAAECWASRSRGRAVHRCGRSPRKNASWMTSSRGRPPSPSSTKSRES
jgi:hypothetical protein